MTRSIYAGISFDKNKTIISVVSGKKIIDKAIIQKGIKRQTSLLSWLRFYSKNTNSKFIAAAMPKTRFFDEIASRLWLELDISPLVYESSEKDKIKLSQKAALFVSKEFNGDNSYSAKTKPDGSVTTPPLASLSAYEAITPLNEIKFLLKLAKAFKGKKIVFFSATPQGGGVALMRHSLIRIFKLLKVNASWYVLKDDPKIYEITKKKFHNVLQNVASNDCSLNEHDKEIFNKWSKNNAVFFKKVFKETDVIVIDDPQPSGLIPYIKKINPKAVILYRSHIQLISKLVDTKGTAQNATWEFIWEKISSADIFISHPIKSFVPVSVPKEKVAFMGATTDRLDGLNKELTDEQKRFYLSEFNRFLVNSGTTPLDHTKPYIIQIARFDPSKGIPDLLEVYKNLSQRLIKNNFEIPELVIVGNGSIDDPDGVPIYNLAKNIISSSEYKFIKDNVKILKVPHYDQLLNTLLRNAVIALQLSYREGYEVKVTEALMKGIPVVAYKSGGIPLQIVDKKSGFLVKTKDKEKVQDALYSLLTNKTLYQKIQTNIPDYISNEANSIRNAIYWLYLANKLSKNKFYKPNSQNMKDIIKPLELNKPF